MELVATLIAAPNAEISPALLEKIVKQTAPKSARTAWLAEGEAVDIFGEGIKADEWRAGVVSCIASEPIDVIVQPAATRRKKLLAADMESTIIQQELLDELAGQIGVRDQVAQITARAMNGEIDFGAALRERVALLTGKPVTLLENAAKLITLMPGAATLVATMKKHGAAAWLITGGFSYFAKPVAAQLGFDQSYANELMVKDGVITGQAGEPILDRNRKKVLLEQACRELKLSLAETVSVGDGSNDIPMLNASNAGGGLGIAYHAKPKVQEEVVHRISHADLTALLYAQGYKKSEFASKHGQ